MSKNRLPFEHIDDLCTGCGTCTISCPNEAIKLCKSEDKGIFLPKFLEDRCVACGTCDKVCPGHNIDFHNLNRWIFGNESSGSIIGNYKNCYYGYSLNENIRYYSASGGLVTELLIFALEEGIIDGALVTRMKKYNPFEPESFIARTRDDIINASKSKYCPVPANIAVKDILNSKEGEHFAVVGLPCHIHGIRKLENHNRKLMEKIIIHIGLWCSTTCSFKATEFVLNREGIIKEEVEKLDYRGEGWPGGMSIYLKSKEKRFIPLADYWDLSFSSFSPYRCRLCIDATSELADISFGDYRGDNAFLHEKKGCSGIISRTEFSEKILDAMSNKEKIKVFKIDENKLSEHQDYFYLKKNVKVNFFFLKLIGRKTPLYNYALNDPKGIYYILTLLSYMQMVLASKRQFWVLLKIFNLTLKNSVKMISNAVSRH